MLGNVAETEGRDKSGGFTVLMALAKYPITYAQELLHREVVYEIMQYKLRHYVALAQPFPSKYHYQNLNRLNLLRLNVSMGYDNVPVQKWFESFSGYHASN